MPKDVVVNGASIHCTGSPQSSFLKVQATLQVKLNGANVGNIDHHKPVLNVLPFGLCMLQKGNPPCMPATPAPWSPGEGTVPMGAKPILDIKSRLKCTHGGKITFLSSGQGKPFFAVDCKASPAAMAFAKWRAAQLRYVEALKAQFAAENEAEHLSTLDMIRNTALETAKEASGYNDAVKALEAAKRGEFLKAAGYIALAAPTPVGKLAKGAKGVRAVSRVVRDGRGVAVRGGQRTAARAGERTAAKRAASSQPQPKPSAKGPVKKGATKRATAKAKRSGDSSPTPVARCPYAPRQVKPAKPHSPSKPKPARTAPKKSATKKATKKGTQRRPINSKYAGKNYPASKLPPKLRSKYPNGVNFTKDGYPDFSPYAQKSVPVEGLKGNTGSDFTRANKAAGLKRTPEGYTWHHHQDGKTMQLVPTDLHDAVRHTGGASILRNKNL